MSEEKPNPEKTAKQRTPVPHPWSRVLLGFSLCLVAAALCAVAVNRYVKTRPLNLRDYTLALRDPIDNALTTSRVPKSNIKKRDPELKAVPGATWYSTEYDVNVPESVDAAGLAKVIGRTMLEYNASSAEQQTDENTRTLSLSLGTYEFALIHIKGKPPRKNLTETCITAANDVTSLLAARGIPASSIARSEPEFREDSASIWQNTRFDVDVPAGFPIFETEAALREALTTRGIMIRTQAAPDTSPRWTLEHDNKPIGEVVLHVVPTPETQEGANPAAPSIPPAPALPSPPQGTEATTPEKNAAPAPDPGEPPAASADTPPPAPNSETPKKAAIIVDDGGYNAEAAAGILALTNKLTVAIIPFTTHDKETATKAKELGFEVMLHLPMQESHIQEQLTTSMTSDQIAATVNAGLERVPGAVGINNHTGSTFMADEVSVRALLQVVKTKPLFFVDSKTTAKSKAVKIAKELGIPVTARDVFLDLEKDPNWFRDQFRQFVEIAAKHGRAVAICHFKPTTVELLKECLPQLDQQGIQLVHVSELLE